MIKRVLRHTIQFIDNYQSHSSENYDDIEKELNNLKKHMVVVVALLSK